MLERLLAVTYFLEAQQQKNPMWSQELETQVSVVPGKRDESGKGLLYRDYSTGDAWYNFRIPKDAKLDSHYYEAKACTFDLHKHCLGIGSTGWNWKQNKSVWVGFDFDSIANHTKGLTVETMEDIMDRIKEIPWTEIRRSKSGLGYHVFVKIEDSPEVTNHGMHAALARSILQQMSGLARFNFSDGVDCVGQNMWLWHREARPGGFDLVKEATEKFTQIPPNWKDHYGAATTKVTRRKALIDSLKRIEGLDDESIQSFVELHSRSNFCALTEKHKRLVSGVIDSKQGWWDKDHNCLVTHTKVLEELHVKLGLTGMFFTIAEGRTENDWNCFCMPSKEGWTVRRYTKGCEEHASWEQDSHGWTYCRLDCPPTFETVARAFGGILGQKNDYEFPNLQEAFKALSALGFTLKAPAVSLMRKATILNKKDMLVVQTPFESHDTASPDSPHKLKWRQEPSDKPKRWSLVVKYREQKEHQELDTFDTIIRAVRFQGKFEGFYFRTTDGGWMMLDRANLKDAVSYCGYEPSEVNNMVGAAITTPWDVVTEPFQPEYLGDRKWNKGAAQLSVEPTQGEFPYWMRILEHMGAGLDETIAAQDPESPIGKWLHKYNVKTGATYLKLWLACCLQRPKESLPYLSFYSVQEGTGKSTFHEMLSTLFLAGRGYVRAELAIKSQQGFNGELHGALICAVEEVNLNKREYADRMKDWVTGRHLQIHQKGGTPYMIENCTHWMQFSNSADYTPLFDRDTRIVMINVPSIPPGDAIDGFKLHESILVENPAFAYELLYMDLPERCGRLQLPVLETLEKQATMEAKTSPFDAFLKDRVFHIDGTLTNVSDLYHAATVWIIKAFGQEVGTQWTDRKMMSAVPRNWIKGLYGPDRKTYFGNISLNPDEPGGTPFRLVNRELTQR